MKLEFLICGSPTDAFFSQIAFFRICLDYLGEEYKKARLVATFGDHTSENIPNRWLPYFNNIEVHWSHPIGHPNIAHQAQHYYRFELISDEADLAFICDADTALLRSFPDLLKINKTHPAIFGVIAHTKMPTSYSWQEIAQQVINCNIPEDYNYTLEELSSKTIAPFYINYGFLAGTPHLLKKLHQQDISLLPSTSKLVGEYWGPQVNITLACESLHLPKKALPMRYNFPNDEIADKIYPDELNSVILMHYLRKSCFDRHLIFSSEKEFNAFLKLKLQGSNRVFQKHVSIVTNNSYPFP